MLILTGLNIIDKDFCLYDARGGKHKGIDIRPDYETNADAIVLTPVDGVITQARCVPRGTDRTWEWGYYVTIDDGNGHLHTLAHLKKDTFNVKVGDKVEQGEALAIVGATGNANYKLYNTGQKEHVHYCVKDRRTGKYVNPCEWAGIENRLGVWADSDNATWMVRLLRPTTGAIYGDTTYNVVMAREVNKSTRDKIVDEIYQNEWLVGDLVVDF